MTIEYIDKNSVFEGFSEVIREVRQEILIAIPRISEEGLVNVLNNLSPYANISRILIKVKEKQDVEMNDLNTLNFLKFNGARIRFCSSLDTKILIIDNNKAIIGSQNITETGMGIHDVPNVDCGIVSDEVQFLTKARQKYEEIWQNAIDYEQGDLRIVENKITYSDTGNKKMTGSLLSALGGGVLYRTLTQPKLQESKPLFDIKVPDPLGIRSKVKGKAKEVIMPMSEEEFIRLQKSFWENISQEFLAEFIQRNAIFVIDTIIPSKFKLLQRANPEVYAAIRIIEFSAENAILFDKYIKQPQNFVYENKDIIEKLKSKGVGKNIISFVEKLNVPDDKKAYFLIGIGLIIISSPAAGMAGSSIPKNQRIALAAIMGQSTGIGVVLMDWGIMKRDSKMTQ